MQFKALLRRKKLRARSGIPAEERKRLSAAAVANIAASELFKSAGNVLIYRAVRSELDLDALPLLPESTGKSFLYPRCTADGEMEACLPDDPGCFIPGYKGISEPDPERSMLVPPGKIDLVICPCSAFDRGLRRLGMGGGFYDRYLPKCENAVLVAAAFEKQRAAFVPVKRHDVRVDAVFTEKRVYTK